MVDILHSYINVQLGLRGGWLHGEPAGDEHQDVLFRQDLLEGKNSQKEIENYQIYKKKLLLILVREILAVKNIIAS